MLCFVAGPDCPCCGSKALWSKGILHAIVVLRRLSTVEGKKRRKATKRRSTRAARGDVSRRACVCCLSELLCPQRRGGVGGGGRLNVSSVWPDAAPVCDVWPRPRSVSPFDTWISLTSTFDVQSSLTSVFVPEKKLLKLEAKTWTRAAAQTLVFSTDATMFHMFCFFSGLPDESVLGISSKF